MHWSATRRTCTTSRRRTFLFHTARRNLGSSRATSHVPGGCFRPPGASDSESRPVNVQKQSEVVHSCSARLPDQTRTNRRLACEKSPAKESRNCVGRGWVTVRASRATRTRCCSETPSSTGSSRSAVWKELAQSCLAMNPRIRLCGECRDAPSLERSERRAGGARR